MPVCTYGNLQFVIPAKAGICMRQLAEDSGFRRNDELNFMCFSMIANNQ